jgi:hypothetical protein
MRVVHRSPLEIFREEFRNEGERGPKSDWARYAYGYSDKKPGAAFWIIHAVMVIYIAANLFTLR